MVRGLMLLAALVAGTSCFVYTCNEVKQILEADSAVPFNGTKACVVLPADVSFPFNDEPYTWYMYNTYLEDADSGMKYELSGMETNGYFCMGGLGPWFIKSDDPAQFVCTSAKYKYAEITFIFTSDEPNIVQASIGGKTATYGKGTHVFVAPEGGLMIQKNSIADGKETTLYFYSGAGVDETEERFPLMPEKFVAGTSTIILGPVTTLVIEDDVTVELTVSSFDERVDISAAPGFDFDLMSSGRANDLQSSRPSITVSTRYGLNDDAFEYDAISITGTVVMDENATTAIRIDCSNVVKGNNTFLIVETADVDIKADCTSLEIIYEGSLRLEDIGRSREVIYLRITSSFDPFVKPPPTDPSVETVSKYYCTCGLVDGWFDGWDPSEIWVDLVVIIDSSASMGDSLEEAKSLLTSFISLMTTDTASDLYSRIGVIAASDTIEVVYNLNMSSSDSLDSVKQHKVDKIDVEAAFQAAFAMFAEGSMRQSYRENARQIIYYLTNSAPGTNMNGVDDFKTRGGIIVVNDFVLEGGAANEGLRNLASDNFFFTDLSDDYLSNLVVLCEANCFCNPSKHAFNDDENSPRTAANRGCFHPVNNGIPQPKARETCQKEQSDLVSIHDQDKEFFVSSVVSIFGPKKKYWIGLQNDGNSWNWDDSSSDPFSDWDTNQPNTNEGKLLCAYATQTIGLNVGWTAANCAMGGVVYVCESAPCSVGNANC